ncbi:MAG: serine hydrolase [SAR86 cluster bacterium]|uniref:Serine hydrolase n=1 Tax=SAR86 cluster bacterium TaxID=2030880 RepID=A0A2A4XEX5_9GAMM|nr:MAG: serine hydrolase [SAR86 cluster bacterium]
MVNSSYCLQNISKLIALFTVLSTLTACNTTTITSSNSIGAESPLPLVAPEEVGMDSERLNRVTTAMQDLVDQGLLAGAVTMAARDNKVMHFESVGYRDIEAQSPMTNDTLFRIYSMSKPVTGVALMALYEEGKFKLSDPVEQYIPEMKDLQVYTGTNADGSMITEAANHKMTIRELMSHTGGLSYGIFSQSPVDSAYLAAGLGAAAAAGILEPNETGKDFVRKLGQIPLKSQPGSQWEYSVSVDVQGYLVEVLSGQKFGEFLEERIFTPLNMLDTAFYVPEEKLNRFSQMYVYDQDGALTASEMFPGADYTSLPAFESGGAGLVSTATDYMHFSQMLLNGGELDGVRILAPLTVDLMHRDQTPKAMAESALDQQGTAFGLDFAVILDPVEAESYSKGEYYWGGAAGTWFWIDPVEDIVFVGMIQVAGPLTPDVRGTSRRLLYQAIMEPKGI